MQQIQIETEEIRDTIFQNHLRDTGCLHRISKDSVRPNNYGKQLLSLCKTTGLYIVNGRMGADLGVGGYTRVDTTGKSLVDYLLATPVTFTMITDLRIHPKTPESDHLPISFNISYKQTLGRNFGTQDRSTWQLHQRYSWVKDNLENLVPTLTDDTSNIYYQHYKRSVSNLENTNVVASNFSVYFNKHVNEHLISNLRKKADSITRGRDGTMLSVV